MTISRPQGELFDTVSSRSIPKQTPIRSGTLRALFTDRIHGQCTWRVNSSGGAAPRRYGASIPSLCRRSNLRVRVEPGPRVAAKRQWIRAHRATPYSDKSPRDLAMLAMPTLARSPNSLKNNASFFGDPLVAFVSAPFRERS